MDEKWSFDTCGPGLVKNLAAICAVTDESISVEHYPLSHIFRAMLFNPVLRFSIFFHLLSHCFLTLLVFGCIALLFL